MNPALPGLMMDVPLTTQHFLWRLRHVHARGRVVTVVDETGTTRETAYGAVAERATRLAAALHRLGVREGDRVGTFSWNSAEHLEAYYGVMGMGAVLHTINLRLHPDQIAWTMRHAGDRVVLLDASLADQLLPVLDQVPCVEHVVLVGTPADGTVVPGALDYEELLAAEEPTFDWPELDERAAASLCYTSGTTGDPKGVLYSHRSITLHALVMAGTEVYRIGGEDCVLSAVPMFHAMGWGLPFVSAVVGNDLVMPSRFLQPAPLARVIRDQAVTWSCGVPTIWMDLLHHVEDPDTDASVDDLRSLRHVISGGTQVPTGLMRRYDEACGTTIVQGWGMTEIFPGATVSQDLPGEGEQQRWSSRATAGRISATYEIRVVAPDGTVQPHDGTSQGEIEVRGPAVAGAYFGAGPEAAEKLHDGWLRTGDVGTVDADGWLRITDRAKDAIKSGGEWISSVDLEAAIMEHPSVREAAVIGRPDERWSERPHAFLVTSEPVGVDELRAFLADRVARWWIPESWDVVDAIPRTSTGKFDKVALRRQL